MLNKLREFNQRVIEALGLGGQKVRSATIRFMADRVAIFQDGLKLAVVEDVKDVTSMGDPARKFVKVPEQEAAG